MANAIVVSTVILSVLVIVAFEVVLDCRRRENGGCHFSIEIGPSKGNKEKQKKKPKKINSFDGEIYEEIRQLLGRHNNNTCNSEVDSNRKVTADKPTSKNRTIQRK